MATTQPNYLDIAKETLKDIKALFWWGLTIQEMLSKKEGWEQDYNGEDGVVGYWKLMEGSPVCGFIAEGKLPRNAKYAVGRNTKSEH